MPMSLAYRNIAGEQVDRKVSREGCSGTLLLPWAGVKRNYQRGRTNE